jgi:hypothetical protein
LVEENVPSLPEFGGRFKDYQHTVAATFAPKGLEKNNSFLNYIVFRV